MTAMDLSGSSRRIQTSPTTKATPAALMARAARTADDAGPAEVLVVPGPDPA